MGRVTTYKEKSVRKDFFEGPDIVESPPPILYPPDENINVIDSPTATTSNREKVLSKRVTTATKFQDELNDIYELSNELEELCYSQTSNIEIPIEPPEVKYSAKILGVKNDMIRSSDWWRIADFTYGNPMFSNMDAASDNISQMQNIDTLNMLWNELMVLIGNWLADTIESVPVAGKEIASRIRDGNRNRKSKTWIGMRDSMPLADSDNVLDLKELTADLKDISNGDDTYFKNMSALSHSNRVIKYVRDYISEPRRLSFNPVAMDTYYIAKMQHRAHLGVANTFNVLYGIDNSTLKPSLGNDISAWGNYEWSKMGARTLLDDKIYSDLYDMGIVNVKNAMALQVDALRDYVTGEDIACCLLSNLGGLAASSDDLSLLKGIRLGLRYAYNGLSLNVGDLFNNIIDVLNQLISEQLGKMVSSLTATLDDRVQGAINGMEKWSNSHGDAWKRCYPFDEMIQAVILSLGNMRKDLEAYINDWVGLWKVSHMHTGEYRLRIKRREYFRKMIQISDLYLKGINTGIICKPLEEIDRKYSVPTREELKRFNEEYKMTVDEYVKTYGVGPITGLPVDEGIGSSSPNELERLWLQDCDLSMTDEEWRIFRQIIAKEA